MTLRFDGRVVVITGAARGLGAAYASLLRERGATVVVNDIEGTADDANDMSTVDGARALIDGTLARHGRVDAVVANAGIMRWAGVRTPRSTSCGPCTSAGRSTWCRRRGRMCAGSC